MTKQERFLLFSLVSEVKDLMCSVCNGSTGCSECAIDAIKSELYPWREGNEVNKISDPTLFEEFCSWRQQKDPDPDPQVKAPTGDCEPSFGGYTTEEYLEYLEYLGSRESLDRLQKKLGL